MAASASSMPEGASRGASMILAECYRDQQVRVSSESQPNALDKSSPGSGGRLSQCVREGFPGTARQRSGT